MKFQVSLLLCMTVLFTSQVAAENDCCFDWGLPGFPGEDDGNDPPDKKPPINNFAQCTPTGKDACFGREWRQVKVLGYSCVPGSLSPNDDMPLNENAGFLCVNKQDPKDFVALRAQKSASDNDVVTVPNLDPSVTVELEWHRVPTVTGVGMLVAGLISCVTAAVVLGYRRRIRIAH